MLEDVLFAGVTLAPIAIAVSARWIYKPLLTESNLKWLLTESNLKWVLGLCLLFSLLGFAADRLTSIKLPGVEAQLAEMKTATDSVYASVAEMEDLKKSLQDLATILARQQALSVMKASRLVGDDFLTENVRSLLELRRTLDELGVPDDKAESILDAVVPYVRIDLKDAASKVVRTTFTENAKTREARLRASKLMADFYDKFMRGYEVGETIKRVEIFLREHEVEMTDAIREAFSRLDAFLGEGRYLDLEGNVVMTFLNPTAPPFLR